MLRKIFCFALVTAKRKKAILSIFPAILGYCVHNLFTFLEDDTQDENHKSLCDMVGASGFEPLIPCV